MSSNSMPPLFPLTVAFDDGECWVLNSESEIPGTLEWFDSDDPDEHATVTDAAGRAVRLRVVALDVQILELK